MSYEMIMLVAFVIFVYAQLHAKAQRDTQARAIAMERHPAGKGR